MLMQNDKNIATYLNMQNIPFIPQHDMLPIHVISYTDAPTHV